MLAYILSVIYVSCASVRSLVLVSVHRRKLSISTDFLENLYYYFHKFRGRLVFVCTLCFRTFSRYIWRMCRRVRKDGNLCSLMLSPQIVVRDIGLTSVPKNFFVATNLRFLISIVDFEFSPPPPHMLAILRVSFEVRER